MQCGLSFRLRKHSKNLPPQTSPNHLCALQVGPKPPKSDIAKKNIGTKLSSRANKLIWIASCHFRRVGNSNFHGDRSKRIAMSQMSSKRSPDCIATSAAPKAKHPHKAAIKTMFAHTHTHTLQTSPHLYMRLQTRE